MSQVSRSSLGLSSSSSSMVALSSEAGEIVLPLELTDTLCRGVVCAPHGWGHGRAGAKLEVAGGHAGASVEQGDGAAENAIALHGVIDEIAEYAGEDHLRHDLPAAPAKFPEDPHGGSESQRESRRQEKRVSDSNRIL